MQPPEVRTPSEPSGISRCCKCTDQLKVIEDVSISEENLSPLNLGGEPDRSEGPICEDCMNDVLEELKTEIAAANNELSKYTEALFELERERRSGGKTEDENEDKQLVLAQREKELESELDSLRREEESLLEQLRSLDSEEKDLDNDELKLRESIVSLTRTIIDSDESMEAVNRKLQYCQSSLRKLKRTSLIQEAFHIHDEGQSFPSINGLRVGRPNVPWAEVNSALGFLCLLTDVLLKRANVSLSQYRLLPRGSYSVIIKKSDKSVLELFADESSGGLSRFLSGRKFDSAMVAFVQIIGELVTTLQRDDQSVAVPFAIDESEGKIAGVSVTLQFNSEENWNKAMRMLMTDIKWIVRYVEAKFSP